MRKKIPFPEPLRYLQPFIRGLAKIPPDRWNEDLDVSRLEEAARKRFRGYDEVLAEEELAKDCDLLRSWLANSASESHPGHWVLQWLDLAEWHIPALLEEPVVDPPRGPTIHFEAPAGWRMEANPSDIGLWKGGLFGHIRVIDQFAYDLESRRWELWTIPIGQTATLTTVALDLGDVQGKKYIYQSTAPKDAQLVEHPLGSTGQTIHVRAVASKRVDYLLRVPGGLIVATLRTRGTNFDETPFDRRLPTLRVSDPPPPAP